MKFMIDKKQIIIALKKVRDERELNIDQIYDIVYDFDPKNCPSRSSIARVFAEGSEDDASHFRFEATLKPICDALLDIETDEQDDTADDLAYKSLLRYKKDLIEQYAEQLKEAKDELKAVKDKERERYNKKIEEMTANFNKSITFAKEQIALKDHRIDQLLNSNDRLSLTNTKLIEQLMDCPLRKDCKEDAP